MEATCSFETSFGIQWTARRYVPEGMTLRNHRSENLKCLRLNRDRASPVTKPPVCLFRKCIQFCPCTVDILYILSVRAVPLCVILPFTLRSSRYRSSSTAIWTVVSLTTVTLWPIDPLLRGDSRNIHAYNSRTVFSTWSVPRCFNGEVWSLVSSVEICMGGFDERTWVREAEESPLLEAFTK
jgi:hypothetical protein